MTMAYTTDPLHVCQRKRARLREYLERILAVADDPANAENLALADIRRLCREGLHAAEASADDWAT